MHMGLWEYVLGVCMHVRVSPPDVYLSSVFLIFLCMFIQQSACLCLVYSYTNSLVAQSWPSVITRHHANPPLSPMRASEWLVGSEKHSLLPTWRKQTTHSYTQNTAEANNVYQYAFIFAQARGTDKLFTSRHIWYFRFDFRSSW